MFFFFVVLLLISVKLSSRKMLRYFITLQSSGHCQINVANAKPCLSFICDMQIVLVLSLTCILCATVAINGIMYLAVFTFQTFKSKFCQTCFSYQS